MCNIIVSEQNDIVGCDEIKTRKPQRHHGSTRVNPSRLMVCILLFLFYQLFAIASTFITVIFKMPTHYGKTAAFFDDIRPAFRAGRFVYRRILNCYKT